MRFLTRSLIALFLVALSAAALGYAAYTVMTAVQSRADAPGRPAESRERVFTVRAVTVTAQEVTPVLSAFGEVRTRRALDLRAPVSGRILELSDGVEDGARVEEGQILARLDPADAATALALARSDMARAEAELRDADRAMGLAAEDVEAAQLQYDLRARALDRIEGLSARGIATDAALEDAQLARAAARAALVGRRQAEAQAEARLDQARAALERQRITMDEAQRRLDETTIRAGFTGVLSDVAVAEGEMVSSNEHLLRIIDPDALDVSTRISTAQYLRLLGPEGTLGDHGAQVTLEVAGFEITSPGEITRVSATVATGESGRRLFVALEAPRGFRPGDFVTVRLNEPALRDVARLPASAITPQGEVLEITSDNRLQATPVEILRREGDDVIIAASLLDGLEIVRDVTPSLGTGILVRPMRDADTDAPEDQAAMIHLDPDERARLIAQVEGNMAMPAPVRARMIAQISEGEVPARMLERLRAGPGPSGG